MASSSSSSKMWNHDVFLSFRGEETRKTFVDHLYSALLQKGIHTYKDDETLPRGVTISPALSKAIEESRIALIVFSENYAESSWCLEELACIMKCKDTRGQTVMPIFYHVEPSEVRKLNRKYGEAFAKHESVMNNNKIESWRKALFDASNISGWEIKHIANGHESKGIKEIVDTISDTLFQLISDVNQDLIGIRTRVQDLKSQLELGSGGVRIAGIWGLGGGGKTTLASSLYNEISSKFDDCCFLENIREESSKYGLKKLQENILRKILKQKEIEVNRVEEGRHMISSRFHHRKVLIVLDDADQLDQLKSLAGSHDWFGEGSRIIITTRDKHLLNAHKVNVIYNVSLLNDVEAIQLFHKHAFLDCRPAKAYETLSKDVVSYAGGLPLAVKVLGSFLCDKDVNEWKSALARLKDIPEDDIMEKLKISYDGLKSIEKELFLDIACFFRRIPNWYKPLVMRILDVCGFHVVIGIKVLIEKALITIGDGGEFDMHDLVQEMARYVVRAGHSNNPAKHSRIWREEDILKISAMDATTENYTIEAIPPSLLSHIPHRLSQILGNMKILQENYTIEAIPPSLLSHVPHRLSQILGNMKILRWIIWDYYPETSLPTNFQPMMLCYLRLGRSLVKQLWEGYKHLPSLKVLDLNGSNSLIKTPDFSGLPCLEELILKECEHLEEIHPSIGYHERLVFLDMAGCQNLQSFPPIIRMKKLETLDFSSCCQLHKFPEIQMKMDSLKRLYLGFCQHLESFISNCHLLKHLKELHLGWCGLIDESIPSDISDLSNLKVLDLGGNRFSRIGSSLSQLAHLKYLNISHCTSLIELPDLPSSISVLDASECRSLKIVGDFPTNCKWLWKVSLQRKRGGGHIDVERVIRSMLEGNAIEDHYISLRVSRIDVPVPVWYGRFLKLPQNWYNDFTGFWLRVVGDIYFGCKIVIKHMDSRFDILPRSCETAECVYMCYIPFGSLRHTSWWNSLYSATGISFEVERAKCIAALVPRRKKRNGDSIEGASTYCSEFRDYEFGNLKTFTIMHDSKSSLEILWFHGY